MIAVIASDNTLRQLEGLKQFGLYEFYIVAGRTLPDIGAEVSQLAACSYFVVDVDVLDADTCNQLLQEFSCGWRVILLTRTYRTYDTAVRTFYDFGAANVIYGSGVAMLKTLHKALKQQGDTIPALKVKSAADTADRESKPNYAHRYSTRNIAFAGAGRRIGVTTQVFQTARYLQNVGSSVAVIDMANHSWLVQPGNKTVIQLDKKEYLVYGIPYYTSPSEGTWVNSNYEYLLYDCGVFDPFVESFGKADRKVVVCGCKPNEQSLLPAVFDSGIEDVQFLYSFVPRGEQEAVLAAMGTYAPKTYFAFYAPGYHIYYGSNELYRDIIGAGHTTLAGKTPWRGKRGGK